MEGNLLNKTLYKLLLATIKYLPVFLGIFYVIYTSLQYFGIDLRICNYLFFQSTSSIIFLYLTSYALKFCYKHRLFIHYLLCINIINLINYYTGFIISDFNIVCIVYILFFITSILYITTNEFKKISCRLSTRDSR